MPPGADPVRQAPDGERESDSSQPRIHRLSRLLRGTAPARPARR